MPDPLFIPPQVREFADDLKDLTDIPAVITRPRPGAFTVEHGNDRVRVVCRWTRGTGARLSYASELFVDGVPRPKVNGMRAYARLFKNPDLKHPDRVPSELPPLQPIPADQVLPSMVEMVHGRLLATAAHDGLPQDAVLLGRDTSDSEASDDHYVIEIRKANGTRAQMMLEPVASGSAAYGMTGLRAMDADGGNLMGKYGEDHERALMDLLGIKMPSSAAPPPRAAPRPEPRGAVSNAVRERRHSVIRN